MSGIVGAAVVPAAPLTLRAASPDQPGELRDGVATLRRLARSAIDALPPADAYVLISAGPRGIYDRAYATLEPLGVPGAELELPVAEALVEHLSRLTQYPVFRGDPLEIGLAVLARQLQEARGEVPVVAMNVARGTDFDVLVSVGAAIGEAAADAGLDVAIVVAGDLSAGLDGSSPSYAIAGAGDFDASVVAAARAGDLAALRELGPDEAERVRALGWAALAALHGACAAGGLSVEVLGYEAPAGVGQLVARCVAADEVPAS